MFSFVACALVGVLSLGARLDEPKPFLVVVGEASQIVVDVAAFDPSKSDNQRVVDQLPERGIVHPGGLRLAYAEAKGTESRRTLYVVDLNPAIEDHEPHPASQPRRGLDLIGWVGRSRVLIRVRENPTGDMLRIIDARLPKDSVFKDTQDVTATPGVYEHARARVTGEVVYFAKKDKDAGDVLVWSKGASEVVATGVTATALCWSPDGSKVAVAEVGKITLYDLSKKTPPKVLSLPQTNRQEPARIGSMAWRPDGTSIALLPDCPNPDHPPHNPQVWSVNVETGTCMVLVQLSTPARRVRWLSDTGCDTTLDQACKDAIKPVRGQRP